jgi:hypothetical protein
MASVGELLPDGKVTAYDCLASDPGHSTLSKQRIFLNS